VSLFDRNESIKREKCGEELRLLPLLFEMLT
jgi:hypothetical protein